MLIASCYYTSKALVTTSVALVTTSDALVTTSDALVTTRTLKSSWLHGSGVHHLLVEDGRGTCTHPRESIIIVHVTMRIQGSDFQHLQPCFDVSPAIDVNVPFPLGMRLPTYWNWKSPAVPTTKHIVLERP